MEHRPLVLLDVETSGGNKDTGRIIEIGGLRIERGNVLSTYKQLVNPEQKIPHYITKLTGITNDMVWSAPTFKAIAGDLETFLNGAVFISHYVQFDYGFIKAEYNRIGHKFNMDRACTVKLSRNLYPSKNRHSLDHIIDRLNLKVKNRHRAYDDAEVLWKLIDNELNSNPYNLFRQLDKIIIYTK